ncbi:MAG: AMP-binding protein, partial [Pseudomonadota bacterium]
MSRPSIYEQDLGQNAANYVPLSPLSWLARCAHIFPTRTALIHGDLRQDWATTHRRCRQLASALAGRGIGKGDTVAVMAPNVPALYEAHFGVPMCGAVLNTVNIRLDAAAIRFILEHGEARVLITDCEFSDTIAEAVKGMSPAPLVIDIDDPLARSGERLSDIDYESFLAEGAADFPCARPDNEWDAISLNYTSGTTGNPKGVVYHHRGAYLNSLGNVLAWALPKDTVYLW